MWKRLGLVKLLKAQQKDNVAPRIAIKKSKFLRSQQVKSLKPEYLNKKHNVYSVLAAKII